MVMSYHKTEDKKGYTIAKVLKENNRIHHGKIITSLEDMYEGKYNAHVDALKIYNEDIKNAKNVWLFDITKYKNYLTKGTVMVVGCSIGYRVWALRFLGIEAYGMDVSEFAIENAVPEIKQFLKLGNIIDYQEDRKYDNVIAFDILEHIPVDDLGKAIKNCERLTNKKFIAREPYYEEMPNFAYKRKEVVMEHMIEMPPEFWDDELNKSFLIKDWNMKTIEEGKTNWWMLIREKK